MFGLSVEVLFIFFPIFFQEFLGLWVGWPNLEVGEPGWVPLKSYKLAQPTRGPRWVLILFCNNGHSRNAFIPQTRKEKIRRFQGVGLSAFSRLNEHHFRFVPDLDWRKKCKGHSTLFLFFLSFHQSTHYIHVIDMLADPLTTCHSFGKWSKILWENGFEYYTACSESSSFNKLFFSTTFFVAWPGNFWD